LEVRAQGVAGVNAEWRLEHTTIGAFAEARESVSIDTGDRAQVLGVGGVVGQQLGEFFAMSARSGSTWQVAEINSEKIPTHTWFAALALTLRAPDIRF
jgi:hypothetical protein